MRFLSFRIASSNFKAAVDFDVHDEDDVWFSEHPSSDGPPTADAEEFPHSVGDDIPELLFFR